MDLGNRERLFNCKWVLLEWIEIMCNVLLQHFSSRFCAVKEQGGGTKAYSGQRTFCSEFIIAFLVAHFPAQNQSVNLC